MSDSDIEHDHQNDENVMDVDIDIEDGSDVEEDESEGYETEQEVFDEGILSDLEDREQVDLTVVEPQGCCHYLANNLEESLQLNTSQICAFTTKKFPEQLECLIVEINQLVNNSIVLSRYATESDKTCVLDHFLRYRHEVLSDSLLGCLKLDKRKTDIAFCEVVPISSRRTPDFIEKTSDDKIVIIEITAVSDVERGAKAKGDVSKGFESKYEREIKELKLLNFEVDYSVIIFDVRDEYNRDHIASVNELAHRLCIDVDVGLLHKIEYVRKEFCNATRIFNDLYGKYYKYLFSEPYVIKSMSKFESLYIYGEPENKFDESYVRYPISNYMYESTQRLSIRLPAMIESISKNPKLNDAKFLIKLDCKNDKFTFVKDSNGAFIDEWDLACNRNSRLWMCKNMRVVDSGTEIQQRADFEYFDLAPQTTKHEVRLYPNSKLNFDKHTGSTKFVGDILIKSYDLIIRSQEYANKLSIYEDKYYESQLLDKMTTFNRASDLNENVGTKNRPFCDSVVGEEMFDVAIKKYDKKMLELNQVVEDNGKIWVKSPFIYPLYSPREDHLVSLEEKPTELLLQMTNWNLGPYTEKIIYGCLPDHFKFGTHTMPNESGLSEVRRKLGDYTREVNAKLKTLNKSNPSIKARIEDLEGGLEMKNILKKLNEEARVEAKRAGIIDKKIGLFKFNNKTRSQALFKEEMKHFKSKTTPSFYKGIGMNYNEDLVCNQMEGLFSVLLGPSPVMSTWEILDDKVYKDSRLLQELKEKAIDEVDSFYKHLKNTNLYGSCEFISKFCHSLLYHSQTSANTSIVAVDNLGYKGVLLLVKGGKKIFGTKRTKLFRLFYPTYINCASLYEHMGHTGSFDVKWMNDVTYICTPWMNLHETVVTDGLTLCHRLMGFMLLNRMPNKEHSENIEKTFFNVMLALHNRRQTEMLMHNLRYVFMNCMSHFSSLDQILPELAGFNYDLFQVWLRCKISSNFGKFAREMKNLHDKSSKGNLKLILSKSDLRHPFLEFKINELETLALSVYSTYLMSKAPTTQTLEQISNLKGMCETHDEFLECVGNTQNAVCTVDDKDIKGYHDELFKSDFNYDPKYCVLLGKFFGDYLSQITIEKNIHLKWEQILEGCWNSLANTKGLRYKGKDFFGSKGYYVVNKCILEEGDGYNQINKLLDLIDSEQTAHEKSKRLKEFNETFRQRIATVPFNDAVFHVVDKKQRGGKREIFVMDMETKVHQQVIEKFMAYLCKLTPNEMISIPSNRRLQTIHSRVFEAKGMTDDQCFMVLDCRKWAPKSMIDKFLLFLTGLNGFLPSSFILHCQNFFFLLMNKKVYTRSHIYENFEKNQGLKKYTKFFVEDKENGGYYYKPEYSWVMGIFNYFSSLFHVACQMHIAHLLRVNFSSNFNSECTLHMVAHSDDSAGRIICDSLPLIRRGLFYYELFMHSANHLISKKKSNVGKTYYEFISILYIGGELLSLLAKFSGIFNFHPSDKGYCTDITDAYSKCLELMLNGASLNQAYIAMKIQADLIYKFYFNSKPAAISYELPPAMFGGIDAHPLMVMLCGSDADVVRIFHTSNDEQINMLISINECLLPPGASGDGLFKQFKTNPNVRLNPKLKQMKDKYPIRENFKNSWSLKNLRYQNTSLDLAQFLIKLDDKGFVAALQDESIVRRISRSYYYRSGISVETKFGMLKMKEIRELIFLLKESMEENKDDLGEDVLKILNEAKVEILNEIEGPKTLMKNTFNFVYNEAICLNQHLDKFKLKKENIIMSKKTCKPVHFSVQSTIEACPIEFDPSSLVSWIKEPNLRFMIPDVKGLLTAQNYLDKVLNKFELSFDTLPAENLFTLVQKIHRKSKVEFFCYSNLPAGVREISTYQDVMLFLAHNSNSHEYIKGLDVQYGKTISTSSWVMLPDFDDSSLQWTMAFYLILLTIMKSAKDDINLILEIMVKPPGFLQIPETACTILKVFAITRKFWSGRYKHERYLMPYMHQIECLIDGRLNLSSEILCDTYFYTFLKRQFLVDNLWLGRGRMFISCGQFKIVINMNNVKLTHVTIKDFDHIFTNDELAYINFCLHNSQLPSINSSFRNIGVDDWDRMMLGINEHGVYYVGKGRDMVSGIDAELNVNLNTVLSQMDLGHCEFGKKGKVVWKKDDEDIHYKYLLTFIPLSPQNSMDLLKDFVINNAWNVNLMAKFNSAPSRFLLDMCVEDLEIEVTLNPSKILAAHSSSMTYKILKFCEERQLCKVKVDKPNYSHYPAQDGGLMRALIEYAKANSDFDFRWEHNISPEYMTLKSTQPDAFTTELFDNIKDNYEKLFTKEDKNMLMRAVSGLLTDRNLTEGQIMKTASEWGFVGVQGALDSMLGSKKQENFKGIRSHHEGVLRTYYSKVFWEVNKALYKLLCSYIFKNPQGFELKPNGWDHINSNNYKNHYISFVHQIIMCCYRTAPRRNYSVRHCEMFAFTLLNTFLDDKKMCEEFSNEISKIANFRTLPCRPTDVGDWYILWNTLLKNYEDENFYGESVDYISVVDRKLSISFPYTQTKEFCNQIGIKFDLKRTYHSGAISSTLFSRYSDDYKSMYDNKRIVIKMQVIRDLRGRSVPLSPFIFPRHPFKEKFLDSDEYEDVLMELQSTDFDDDSYNDAIEAFEDGRVYNITPVKCLKLSERGRLIDTLMLEIKVLYLLGGDYTLRNLGYLRQQGENLMLITDHLDLQMPTMNNPPLIFRNVDDRWQNQSLLNPQGLFIYIFTLNYRDVDFWERTLGLRQVTATNFINIRNLELTCFMTGAGIKTGNLNLEDNIQATQFYETTTKLLDEKDENEKDTDEVSNADIASTSDSKDLEANEIDLEENFKRKLEESGMDVENSNKYLNMFKNELTKKKEKDNNVDSKCYYKDLVDYFQSAFMKNSKGEEEIIKIKSAFSRILKKDLTVEQRELIFQVPLIFGGNRSRKKGINNKTLRNPYFLSEIESISPGLIWDLLSGSLGISSTSRKRWNNQLKVLNLMSKDLKFNSKGKKFYLNLLKLILNDAKPVKEEDRESERWSDLIHRSTEIFVEGEDLDSEEEDIFSDPINVGMLEYEISGSSNI